MELRSLRYFVEIAERGSVTKAAHRLRVAQPSLTRQIHNLEQTLDVTLFTRMARGVAVTEAGELLLDLARRLLRDAERIQAVLHEHDKDPGGQVLMGLPPTLGPVLLPQLFSRLRAQYPRITLSIVPSSNRTVADWLITGAVDIALMTRNDSHPELHSVEVAREEMVLLSSPSRAAAGFVTAEMLEKLPIAVTGSLLAITEELLAPYHVRPRVELIVNNLDAVRSMAQQGMFATIVPYAITRDDHLAGRVAARGLLKTGLYRRLVMGASVRRPMTAAMQAVTRLSQTIMAEAEAAGGLRLTKERGGKGARR
jgi:LysR family nitrogen assimilation transcriptional regulator